MNASIKKSTLSSVIDQHSTIVVKRNILIDYIYRSLCKISFLSYSRSFCVGMTVPFEELCVIWITHRFLSSLEDNDILGCIKTYGTQM